VYIYICCQVSDIRVILTTVQETIRQLGAHSFQQEAPALQYVQGLTEQTFGIVIEINVILGSGLIKYSNGTQTPEFSRRGWLRNRGRVEQLSQSLRDVRRDLAAALTLLTALVELINQRK